MKRAFIACSLAIAWMGICAPGHAQDGPQARRIIRERPQPSAAVQLRPRGRPLVALNTGGHTAPVTRLLFTPDDELISVSMDKTLRFWDVGSGELLRTLRPTAASGQLGMLYAAALSPDGKLLAAAGVTLDKSAQKNAIYLIGLPAGRLEATFHGHTQPITSVAFGPAGEQLASCSADGTILLWDLERRRAIRRLAGHKRAVSGISFSPDGSRLASSSLDGTGRIWSTTTGSFRAELRGHSSGLRCVAWSPDGETIATGGMDETILLWSADGRVKDRFTGRGNFVFSLAFSDDSRRLVYSVGGPKEYQGGFLLDLQERRLDAVFKGHNNSVLACALAPPDGDGRQTLAATGGGDGNEVCVWRTEDASLVHRLQGETAVPWGVGWSERGPVVRFSHDKRARDNRAFPLENAFHLADMVWLSDAPGTAVRWLSRVRDSRLLERNEDGVLLSRGGRRVRCELDRKTQGRLTCFTFLPDGRCALGTTTGLFVYDANGQLSRRLLGHTAEIWELAPSPDGRYLLSVSQDMTISLWDPNLVLPAKEAGTGISIKSRSDGALVTGITPGGAAHRDGRLRAGDVIIGVGEQRGEMIDVAGRSANDIRNIIVGTEGTTVVLRVKRSVDGKVVEYGLARRRISRVVDNVLPLLSFYSQGRDWIAWTPEGYYDASPGGERLMGWIVAQDAETLPAFYPAAQFRKSLHRPDVIKRLYQHGSLAAALASIERPRSGPEQLTEVINVLPPLVAITQPGDSPYRVRQASLRIKALAQSSSDHPIQSMQLLLNGRPYVGGEGVKRFREAVDGPLVTEFKLALEPGEHDIAVMASSTASDAISAPVRVLYEPPIVPGSEKGKSTLRILAIGIADYPEERFKLEYSDDDARTLVATLQEHSKDLFDEIIVVQTLLNAQAKRRAIMDALSNFSKQMSPRDVGVVFYSGHGVQDRFGEFCLFPADGDETAVAETSVPEGFLKNICRTTPGRLLLLLDACHTGAFGGVSDGFVQDISHEQYGVIVMASSAGAEFSLESDEWGHGAFTKSLIEGLTSHGDVNGDGRVFFHELYGYCTDRVPQLTGGRQHPVMAKPLTVHSFALASRPSEVQ